MKIFHSLLAFLLFTTTIMASSFVPDPIPVCIVGVDDDGTGEFVSDNGASNAAPGDAGVADDDFYCGTEPENQFERAVTDGDPNDRIHVDLAETPAADDVYRLTIDTVFNNNFSDGAGHFDASVNGNLVLDEAETPTGDSAVVFVTEFSAGSVGLAAGDNVIQITKSDPGDNGWIQFDQIKLEQIPPSPLDKESVWMLGVDDSDIAEFGGESGSANAAPGDAAAVDDDYYFAGDYAMPIGTVAADEATANYERALVGSDQTNRIHFTLDSAPDGNTDYELIWDNIFNGGDGSFSTANITMSVNGNELLSDTTSVGADKVFVATFKASDVTLAAGENVVEISSDITGGWIQFDFVAMNKLPEDLDDDGLFDAYEELFFPGDLTQISGTGDLDNDGVTDSDEFDLCTDPTDDDSDDDGTLDGVEVAQGTGPLDGGSFPPISTDIFVLGIDDGGTGEFVQDNGASNPVPGDAGVADDDFYWGTEPDAQFERAVTDSDPNNRIYVDLAATPDAGDVYSLTVDTVFNNNFSDGAGHFDASINGNVLLDEAETPTGDSAVVFVTNFMAGDAGLTAGQNVLTITKSDPGDGGWIQFDQIILTTFITAGDADNDGIADATEARFFGSDLTQLSGTGDLDNDGITDGAEISGGTDPTTANFFDAFCTIGVDDGSVDEFVGEDNASTPAPGSATLADDDYYCAGDYPMPIGSLVENEAVNLMERALTLGDPVNRFHFSLDETPAADEVYNFHWDNCCNGGDFGVATVTVNVNGTDVLVDSAANGVDGLYVAVFSADKAGLVAGENVVTVDADFGGVGGWIQFDQISIGKEVTFDPNDTDMDGLPDDLELMFGALEDFAPGGDNDSDNLLDEDELLTTGTNPANDDTDDDGLNDYVEVNGNTNALDADSDDDGLDDGTEVADGTDPIDSDSDDDGASDQVESVAGTLPNDGGSTPDPFDACMFQLGEDDNSNADMIQENGASNDPPGDPAAADDDYYVGTEPLANMERAVTGADRNVRLHFDYTAEQAAADQVYVLTIDMFDGESGRPHNISASINSNSLIDFNIADETGGTFVVAFNAQDVAAEGDNVIEISKTNDGGWIQFDYISLKTTTLDSEAPMITCPDNVSVDGGCVAGATAVMFNPPVVSDNVDQAGDITVVCDSTSGSMFADGMTTVTCTATDTSGNAAQCTFEVTVTCDNEAPVITVPNDISVNGCDENGQANVTYTASAMDTVDGDVTPVCDVPSGSDFDDGDTTVTCSATDAAGNMSMDSFTVSVNCGGSQRPGDYTQDGNAADITDGITVLELIILGTSSGGLTEMPCGPDFQSEANRAAQDINLDGLIDITDGIYLLEFLILGSSPPMQGLDCILVPGCPDSCIAP
jgi:hypothetical protein